jgi:hypothetical protein
MELENKDDFETCVICKEQFDKKELWEVILHDHKQIPLDDFIGIKGKRIK